MTMRVFEHFNQAGDPCPVCGTKDDKPTVLVPIPGTEKGNIMQAKQTHEECWLSASAPSDEWENSGDYDTQRLSEQTFHTVSVSDSGGDPVAIVYGKTAEECRDRAEQIATLPQLIDVMARAFAHVSHGGPTRGEVEAVLRKAGVL
jgi:hypothetical protein